MNPSDRPRDPRCTVLVVEDDLNDRTLLRHVFRKAAPQVRLHIANDAFQAEDYLTGKGLYADRFQHPFPALVLLDLKLPRKPGLELLAWMNEQAIVPTLPVFVLSSSQESRDIDRAYQLGARSYLVKTVDLRELLRIAEGIGAYAELLYRQPASTIS